MIITHQQAVEAHEAIVEYGSVRKAAVALGLTRSALHRRAKKYAPKEHAVERWAIFNDVHEPYGNAEAKRIAYEYALSQGLNGVILAGDYCDFYGLSHWKKDPLRMSFVDEVNYAAEALKRDSKLFTGLKKIYIQGNHEMRMRSYLWTTAKELAGLRSLDIREILELDRLGWQYVDTIERMAKGGHPVKLGHLHIIHGHELGNTSTTINVARSLYLRCQVNVAAGHFHQAQEYIHRKLDGSHEAGWAIGCLCNLSEEYAPINNWCHGFALVEVFANGDFSLANKKIINGRVL